MCKGIAVDDFQRPDHVPPSFRRPRTDHARIATSIGRRAVLLAGGAAAARSAAGALPIPPGDTLAFRLVRHGSEIGRHVLTFERLGSVLTVRIAVDARVTLLSIPIVRYSHRAVESWQGETLISLTAETDKNGRRQWASAHRDSEGLAVSGSQTRSYIAPEQAGCTSYWQKRMVDRPMISLEDGVLLSPKVTVHDAETIPLASGTTISANHYALSGAFDVDLWYDKTNTWASLAYTARDGSTVHYERL